MLNLSEKDWQIIGFMLRLGVYTTVVSLPFGVIAMRKYPNNPLIPVALIGFVAVAVRSVMNGSFLQDQAQFNS